MNPLIQPKNATPLILIALLLACLPLSPVARAVVPAPDGGYPGQNTAEGQGALLHLAGGTYNTALGWASLGSDVIGNYNTAIGAGALLANTGQNGSNNTATGAGALLNNTLGNSNTATGFFALFSNTTGSANIATGDGALNRNSSGNFNTAVGISALNNNMTGDNNTAIGISALNNNSTGFHNTAVGDSAGAGVTTASNVICIGTAGNNVDNACYIGQIFGATSSMGIAVFINSNGRLGTATSSRRFKEEIKPMGKTSEVLLALKPVTFRYKSDIDPAGTPQFGLVAEEVEKVKPELVVRDKEGKPYSVRYDQVNAMLLNEFLKEHKKTEKLEATVASLIATVKEQAAQIQKVSAQLEASKPAPQVVNNP